MCGIPRRRAGRACLCGENASAWSVTPPPPPTQPAKWCTAPRLALLLLLLPDANGGGRRATHEEEGSLGGVVAEEEEAALVGEQRRFSWATAEEENCLWGRNDPYSSARGSPNGPPPSRCSPRPAIRGGGLFAFYSEISSLLFYATTPDAYRAEGSPPRFFLRLEKKKWEKGFSISFSFLVLAKCGAQLRRSAAAPRRRPRWWWWWWKWCPSCVRRLRGWS